MNRKIKIRVWAGGLIQRMFYPDGIDIHGIGEICAETQDNWWVGENDIIMEFTGIKDKKGREICEGDILLVPGNPDPLAGNPNDLVVVEYDSGSFVYRTENNNVDSITSIMGYGVEIDEDAEIIGNIYENSDFFIKNKVW